MKTLLIKHNRQPIILVAVLLVFALALTACTTTAASPAYDDYYIWYVNGNTDDDPFYEWAIHSFDKAYGLNEDEFSTLVLYEQKYTVRSDGKSETFFFSDELRSLFEDYGNDYSGYRRPMPTVSFENDKILLKALALPEGISSKEFSEIPLSEVDIINNEDIVYEFLMRTYGIKKEEVAYMFLHNYCILVDHGDCGDETCDIRNVTVPVAVSELIGELTDGRLIKLPVDDPAFNFATGDKFYLKLSENGYIIEADAYPWIWENP